MSQGFHVCDKNCLPGCKHRQAGSGGVGRPKANPVQRRDTPREKAYRAEHRVCEAHNPAAELHHVDRRQNRASSRLLMLCAAHHAKVHAGRLDDGRRSA